MRGMQMMLWVVAALVVSMMLVNGFGAFHAARSPIGGVGPGENPPGRLTLLQGETVVATWQVEGRYHAVAFSPDGRSMAVSRSRYPASYELIAAAGRISEPLGWALLIAGIPFATTLLATGEDIVLIDLPADDPR